MFEHYKSRMAHRGANMSEMLRMQSNMVIEQTWDRDPNYRRVYVVKVSHGLPEVTDKHELIDVKFNIDTYQRVDSNEPAYHIQFRHGAEKRNPDIEVGSYVYMADEDGEWKWWLIVGEDERPAFRQYHIIECNYKLGWILDGKIYHHLGVLRSGNSGDVDENTYTSTVNGTMYCWLPTTSDSALITYNQRFLISDEMRSTPLAWEVSRISDTQPLGITKLKLQQITFDEHHDNADLMLAGYYSDSIEPVPSGPEEETKEAILITYSGTKPTVKVGGPGKLFTAQLPDDNHFDIMWSISDADNIYTTNSYDNNTETYGDYIITTTDRTLHLKIGQNYNLVGTELTITAHCANGDEGSMRVEVIA